MSVPLLGVLRILLDNADLPVAKSLLSVIREDAAVDEHAEWAKRIKQLPVYLQEQAYSMADEPSSFTSTGMNQTDNPVAQEETIDNLL